MRSKSQSQRKSVLAGLMASVFLIASCGGGGQDTNDMGSAAGSAPAAAPQPPPATARAGSATLSWSAPPASVTGYRVYFGTASRNYIQAIGSGEFVASSTYVVTGLQSGRTYYFTVTSIDAAGSESGFSNEASKTIP